MVPFPATGAVYSSSLLKNPSLRKHEVGKNLSHNRSKIPIHPNKQSEEKEEMELTTDEG